LKYTILIRIIITIKTIIVNNNSFSDSVNMKYFNNSNSENNNIVITNVVNSSSGENHVNLSNFLNKERV